MPYTRGLERKPGVAIARSSALNSIKGLLAEESRGGRGEPRCWQVALCSGPIPPLWRPDWETVPFMLRRVGGERTRALICIRCAEGLTDVWVEAVTAGMVSGEGGLDASSPGNTPAHRGEGRQLRRAFSCVRGRGKRVDSQLATEAGMVRFPRLLVYAGV